MKRDSAVVNTASNFVTTWMSFALAFVTGVIVTRALGPELKGEYASLRLVVILYAPILLFGYQGGVLYFGIRSIIDLRQFFWSGFVFLALISAVFTPILYILAVNGMLGKIASEVDSGNMSLVLIAVPFIFLNAYCERVIQAFHQFRAANFRVVVSGGLTLVYVIIVLMVDRISLRHAIISLLVGQASLLILSIGFIARRVRVSSQLNFKNVLQPYRHGVKTFFTRIIVKSNDKFDQIALSYMLLAGPFGIYCTGVALCNLLTTIPASYVMVFFNQVAEREPEDAVQLYAKAQRITFAITISLSICLVLISYPLIYLVYGVDFVEAVFVVCFYAPGMVFQVAARLSTKLYAGMGRPLMNSIFYLVGFVVSIPFYFLLIPKYGIIGAAIASSMAYLTAFVCSFLQIRREYKLRLRDIVCVRFEDLQFLKSRLRKFPVFRKILS